jgi:hypothetical protein
VGIQRQVHTGWALAIYVPSVGLFLAFLFLKSDLVNLTFLQKKEGIYRCVPVYRPDDRQNKKSMLGVQKVAIHTFRTNGRILWTPFLVNIWR